MKDSRQGESLWMEWDGLGYESIRQSENIFYTVGHVSLDEEVVLRALASCVQRDGIADSLAESFRFISVGEVNYGCAGYVDGDLHLVECDDSGYTAEGEEVDEVFYVTWVEF
jgi:hypothetical protein